MDGRVRPFIFTDSGLASVTVRKRPGYIVFSGVESRLMSPGTTRCGSDGVTLATCQAFFLLNFFPAGFLRRLAARSSILLTMSRMRFSRVRACLAWSTY